MCGKSAEFKKRMRLQALGQARDIEVVEAIYRVTQSLVILFFNQKVVVRVVDSFNVQLQMFRMQPRRLEDRVRAEQQSSMA